MIDIEQVRELRQALWGNGYRPVAIWSPGAVSSTGQPIRGAGKRPQGEDWRQRALRDPPDAVTGSVSSLALSTGILTGMIAGIDVDILAQLLADTVVHRIEHMLGPTPLVRIGRPPKTLLVYRLEHPVAKLATPPKLFLPGSKVQVEVLGDGQQFVADGIHPDTGQPYSWLDGSPTDVALADLPIVTEEMLRDMLDEVERLLRDAGAVEKEKEKPKKERPKSKARREPGQGSRFFRNVNSAALADIERWVEQLFPTAKLQATGAWRVSSEDLGRDLDEDLSIHPDGIRDFGTEENLTPIDLVIEHGESADALAATRWLCDQLGVDPTSLGWHASNGIDEAGLADLEKRIGTGTSNDTKPGSPEAKPELPGGNGAKAEPEPGSVNPSVGGGGSGGDLPPSPPKGAGTGDDGTGGAGEAPPAAVPPLLTQEDIDRRRAEIKQAAAEALAQLNQVYQVVNDAGKVIVMKWRRDPALKRDVLDRITFDDFKRMYLNQGITFLVVKPTEKGPKITFGAANLAKWWLQHPRRRQYIGGVVCDPTDKAPADHLNLWRGFPVTPAPGDWGLLRDHIFRIVCRGEAAHADYVLDWLARLFQHPEVPGEVALVLRGKKGVGKSILGVWVARALGHHGLQITHAEHLVGKFNAHLRDLVMLFADEAFYAGNKQHESVLKGLITEKTVIIEGKNQNVIVVPNMLHLILASNSDWVIPASSDERRYGVLDVLDTRIGDLAYFAAIDRQMREGKLAAMIHELLHRDISGFEVRDVPQTEALQAQKTLSMSSLERWWLAVLSRGFLWKSRHGTPWFSEWYPFYTTALLMGSYLQWCNENRPFNRKNEVQLGTFFAETYTAMRPRGEHPVYEIEHVEPDIDTTAGTGFGGVQTVDAETRTRLRREWLDRYAIARKEHPHGYQVGELVEARVRFTEIHKVDTSWGLDPDE